MACQTINIPSSRLAMIHIRRYKKNENAAPCLRRLFLEGDTTKEIKTTEGEKKTHTISTGKDRDIQVMSEADAVNQKGDYKNNMSKKPGTQPNAGSR